MCYEPITYSLWDVQFKPSPVQCIVYNHMELLADVYPP